MKRRRAAEHRQRAPARQALHTVQTARGPISVYQAIHDDAPRLLEMYQRLSLADAHLRFFSGYRPTIEFIEGWIDRSRRGGAVLIAVVGDCEHGQIIADAGYVPINSDTAELAMTIDRSWRGWLGAYLLDVLVEHARDHGITNLAAEVLTTNCSMMALLRARGCAFEPSEDLSVARVVIGTDGHTPTWSNDGPSPRILIEGSTGSWHGARAAKQAGVGIMICPGPGRGRAHPCPLLVGERCPLVDSADAVIVALPPDQDTDRLLDAHQALSDLDSQPLAVSTAIRERFGELADRPRFDIDPLVSGPETVDAARQAIAEARDRRRIDTTRDADRTAETDCGEHHSR